MPKDSRPPYGPVVFRDRSAGYAFLTRSTATSEQTITWDDGETYPVVDVEISSESHPYYTGKARMLDTQGEVAKFERRYGGRNPNQGRSQGEGEGRGEGEGPELPGLTAEEKLHTGTEGEVEPEDLVLASGREPTPENLEWARRTLAEEGPSAIERQLP